MSDDLAFLRTIIAALGDPAPRLVYADWLEERGDRRAEYLRLTSRLTDLPAAYRDDGQIYADPGWLALNPPGFRYGRGGWAALGDPARTDDPTDRVPGFLTGYSTASVEEDKAEVFAYLMVHPEYVAGRADRDPVLRAKTARMRALLSAFCPSADARFWETVKRARAGPLAPRPEATPHRLSSSTYGQSRLVLAVGASRESDRPRADPLRRFGYPASSIYRRLPRPARTASGSAINKEVANRVLGCPDQSIHRVHLREPDGSMRSRTATRYAAGWRRAGLLIAGA
jgi:uncharacterized protein (TIGR02996 family)